MIAFGLAVAFSAVAGYGVATQVSRHSTATALPVVWGKWVGHNEALNVLVWKKYIKIGGSKSTGPERDTHDSILISTKEAEAIIDAGHYIVIGASSDYKTSDFVPPTEPNTEDPSFNMNDISHDLAMSIINPGGSIWIGGAYSGQIKARHDCHRDHDGSIVCYDYPAQLLISTKDAHAILDSGRGMMYILIGS